MSAAAVALMLLAGLCVSYELIKVSDKKRDDAASLADFSAYLEEQIRYTRAPIAEIFELYRAGHGGFWSFEYFENHPDAEVKRFIEVICTSDYNAALSNAELLKKYTEKEMQKIGENEARVRRAKLVLPPCVAALVVILLL